MDTSNRASRATPRAPKIAPYGTNRQVRERKTKKQNYAKGKLRNKREQASSNGVTPSQKMKPTIVIKHTGTFTWGIPHELKLFTFTKLLIFFKLLDQPSGIYYRWTGEGVGCSLPGGTTFGSVEAGATFTSDPGSTLSADWAVSSLRMLLAISSQRTSITHWAETCSATDLACGNKLSPID